jgi:hypothetical protein
VAMPATAAAFQMNVAEASESIEEDFSAVIRLMERPARLETSETNPAIASSLAAEARS